MGKERKVSYSEMFRQMEDVGLSRKCNTRAIVRFTFMRKSSSAIGMNRKVFMEKGIVR